jgi:hypothetical protein
MATCIAKLGGILLALVSCAALAQASDVDWKAYGFASVDGAAVCFYDSNGVARTPSGHIRVWTKCLLQKELDRVDIQHDFDGRILKNTAQKVVRNYVPPIAATETLDVNQAIAIIQYEETANLSSIQPHAQFFYEINCSERMMRWLSTHVKANGKEGFDDKPSDWKYVQPEGNGAKLINILCAL